MKLSHYSLAQLQPVAACCHGQGRLARERGSQDVQPQGQTRWKMDLSRTDRGRWVDGSQALVAGRVVGPALGMTRSRRSPRRRGTALVCGWRWDLALVFLVAQPCPGVFWSPDCARGPVSRPPPCMLAGPSPQPLPAFPSRPARATARVQFPCLGPSLPSLTWVSPPAAGGVLGRSSALGALRKGAGRRALRV